MKYKVSLRRFVEIVEETFLYIDAESEEKAGEAALKIYDVNHRNWTKKSEDKQEAYTYEVTPVTYYNNTNR